MILLRDSIKFRMLVMVGACLGLIVLLLVSISIYRTNKNTDLASAEAQELLKSSANKLLLAEGALQSGLVQKYFQAGYQSGVDLAGSAVQFRRMVLGGDLPVGRYSFCRSTTTRPRFMNGLPSIVQ